MPIQAQRAIHHCPCPRCRRHPSSRITQEHLAINRLLATLDEKNRRRLVGLLAIQGGPRSRLPLSQVTGLSRNTMRRGKQEIEQQKLKASPRIRRTGAGRPAVEKNSRAS